jgi:hypothetical protein
MVLRYYQLLKLVLELEKILIGAQLQDVMMMDSYLFLQFYKKGPVALGLSYLANEPSIGLIFEELKRKKIIIKPIILFLRAHAKNKILKKIWMNENEGRIVYFRFESSEAYCEMQWVLIPRSVNVIIRIEGKSISMRPTKELPPALKMDDHSEQFNVDNYLDQWLFKFNNPLQSQNTNESQLLKRKERNIEKKKSAIQHLESDLNKFVIPWAEIGDFLKTYQSIDVTEDWKSYILVDAGLASNIQNCFEQAKHQEKKRQSLVEKIEYLKKELFALESESAIEITHSSKNADRQSVGSVFMQKAGAKGRKLILNENSEAVIGKSAKDNLALLRKAQAWDLWIHLKDYPSAHAIIRRPRNKNVNYLDILKVAEWVLRESRARAQIEVGDKYEIVAVECRYVKPIKGDKVGRVIYQNEQNYTLKIK